MEVLLLVAPLLVECQLVLVALPRHYAMEALVSVQPPMNFALSVLRQACPNCIGATRKGSERLRSPNSQTSGGTYEVGMYGTCRAGGAAFAATGACLTGTSDTSTGHGSTLEYVFGGAAGGPAGQGSTILHGAAGGAFSRRGWCQGATAPAFAGDRERCGLAPICARVGATQGSDILPPP